jgi:uncharacterized protein YggE
VTSPSRTISVSGTGRILVTPDIADLHLGVTITAKTVEAARAANAEVMARVVGALRDVGVAAADIQTANLSLMPAYDYSSNRTPPRLTGYTLTNAVAVVLRDLVTVGAAIDGALAAGATSLDAIAFRKRDTAAAETDARRAAVADARTAAEALAGAAGVSIVGVQSISEGGAVVPSPVFRAEAKMAMADASTPVEAGTNEIAITVAVTFLIGDLAG